MALPQCVPDWDTLKVRDRVPVAQPLDDKLGEIEEDCEVVEEVVALAQRELLAVPEAEGEGEGVWPDVKDTRQREKRRRRESALGIAREFRRSAQAENPTRRVEAAQAALRWGELLRAAANTPHTIISDIMIS